MGLNHSLIIIYLPLALNQKNIRMKSVKKIMLVALSMGLIYACSSDDDSGCTAPDVAENIIGKWKATGGSGTIEFKTDSTYTDPQGDLLDIDGVDLVNKTYSATNDSLHLTAADSAGFQSISTTFAIDKNECNRISLEFIAPFELTRQ